jgi:hypothetical protein
MTAHSPWLSDHGLSIKVMLFVPRQRDLSYSSEEAPEAPPPTEKSLEAGGWRTGAGTEEGDLRRRTVPGRRSLDLLDLIGILRVPCSHLRKACPYSGIRASYRARR